MSPVPKRSLSRSCVAVLAIAGAFAPETSGGAAEPADSRAWVSALAALGDTVVRSDQPGAHAAVLVVPVLVAAGADSNSDLGDTVTTPAGGTQAIAARDETERWVPALAFVSGVLGQGADGSLDSDSTVTYRYIGQAAGTVPSYAQTSNAQQARLVPFNGFVTRSLREGKGESFTIGIVGAPGNGALITGIVPATPVLPESGSDLYLTPFVGASAELMTPGVQRVPGRPRLFVHGDASLAFAFDRPVAKEGVPEGAQVPNPALPGYTETQIKGVGSQTSGEVQTLLVSGGLGAAFTLDAWERRLRIKPSFEFLREEIQVTGRLIRVFRKDTGLPVNVNFGRLPGRGNTGQGSPARFLTPIDIEATDTKAFHGIGPGLEVEMDAARAGPVMLTLFVMGRAYKMLGNLDVNVEGTDTITDPDLLGGTQTVSAKFDFSKHSWSYLGGLGLRFRWLPEH